MSSDPTLSVDTTGTGVVSHAGAVTLLRTAEVTGLTVSVAMKKYPLVARSRSPLVAN